MSAVHDQHTGLEPAGGTGGEKRSEIQGVFQEFLHIFLEKQKFTQIFNF